MDIERKSILRLQEAVRDAKAGNQGTSEYIQRGIVAELVKEDAK